MSTATLVKQLKEAGEDFEFYPTTKEMVRCIWEHTKNRVRKSPYDRACGNFGDVLDIGCGTCNFKRWIDEINKPLEKVDGRYRGDERIDRSECATISKYYVIEKSRILLDKLDAETIVLGTDFHENTLIDKPVDTIFCNPPYSEYEEWAARIIKESVCSYIYLIIPERWKNSEKIRLALKTVTAPYNRYTNQFDEKKKAEVIGSFDFLDAERSARAKVDIVFIDKSDTKEGKGFDTFFDEVFGGMEEKTEKSEWQEAQEKVDDLKAELATGKNKIEILCNGYAAAQQKLFEHFKVITNLDADILQTIGIQKAKVKEALKSKFSGLKNIYWNAAFDCLEEITSRLTSKSREAMLNRFTALKTVDFTASNVYALVIWVIKNSNQYYKSQMIDFFRALSAPENVRNYASNKRVFVRDEWGYCNKKHDHYTLDYRIVCTKHALPGFDNNYDYDGLPRKMWHKISDICTVANNLGFRAADIEYPVDYGKKGYAYMSDGTAKLKVLFEFKLYMNGNVHVKFHKEFIKALNVEVARELGWIHSREDIAKEFVPEMAEGAEKYFDRTLQIGLTAAPLMLTGGEENTPAAAETGELF
ncbi:MAG: DUF4942 domain-containing protein [Lentisphaeria bacterium]|nr:DUF4942 domain-containing protein [Lentisphaeria bacterium]